MSTVITQTGFTRILKVSHRHMLHTRERDRERERLPKKKKNAISPIFMLNHHLSYFNVIVVIADNEGAPAAPYVV